MNKPNPPHLTPSVEDDTAVMAAMERYAHAYALLESHPAPTLEDEQTPIFQALTASADAARFAFVAVLDAYMQRKISEALDPKQRTEFGA